MRGGCGCGRQTITHRPHPSPLASSSSPHPSPPPPPGAEPGPAAACAHTGGERLAGLLHGAHAAGPGATGGGQGRRGREGGRGRSGVVMGVGGEVARWSGILGRRPLRRHSDATSHATPMYWFTEHQRGILCHNAPLPPPPPPLTLIFDTHHPMNGYSPNPSPPLLPPLTVPPAAGGAAGAVGHSRQWLQWLGRAAGGRVGRGRLAGAGAGAGWQGQGRGAGCTSSHCKRALISRRRQ